VAYSGLPSIRAHVVSLTHFPGQHASRCTNDFYFRAGSGAAAEQDAVAAARSFGEVVAYAMKATCRRRAVLAHFGEALPPGGCSGCDVCDDAAAVELQVK
jgi:superfamily II DNA helicase RecQ